MENAFCLREPTSLTCISIAIIRFCMISIVSDTIFMKVCKELSMSALISRSRTICLTRVFASTMSLSAVLASVSADAIARSRDPKMFQLCCAFAKSAFAAVSLLSAPAMIACSEAVGF